MTNFSVIIKNKDTLKMLAAEGRTCNFKIKKRREQKKRERQFSNNVKSIAAKMSQKSKLEGVPLPTFFTTSILSSWF